MVKERTLKFLKGLLDFYLGSSIHVSLSVVSLCFITAIHFELSLDWNFVLFVFLGSITGYNFVKFAGIAKLHHRSLTRNLRIIQIFSFLSFLGFVYFVFQIPIEVLLGSALMGIFTLLYAVPVFSRRRNLRAVAGMKVLVIAGVWAGVTTVLPLVNGNIAWSISVGIEFLQRFLFVLALMIPFEIRDLKYDKKDLRTIPQRMGIEGAKKLGYTILIFWTLAEIFKDTANFPSIVAIAISALATGVVLYRTREVQSPYYASFWVEGIPIFWLLVLWIMKSLSSLF